MKRILIFSLNYYPRFIGGVEVALKEITDRISPDDFEFHVLTLRVDSTLPKEENIGNTIVHRIGFSKPNTSIGELNAFPMRLLKHWYQIGAFFAAVRLHRRYHFDGIWAMMAHSCGIPAALFKTVYPRVPYLLTLQEGDPPQAIERMMRPVWPLFRRGFTKADALQPISTFLRAWGMRMGFKGEARVIPNAVTVPHFSQTFSKAEIVAKQKELGKQPGDFFLVTTSRLVHKNGVDDVIRALALLPDHVHFVVYGIGPDEEMLQALAAREAVSHRVHFLGQLSHEDMPLALRACDAFIRPSRSEGMGNSFIEAMAASLPVIATQEGGIADFLFDEERNPDREATGWAVDANSPAQIRDAVLAIGADAKKVKRITACALALVRERYDWDRIALAMHTLLSVLRTQPPVRTPHVVIVESAARDEEDTSLSADVLSRALTTYGWSGVTVRALPLTHVPPVIRGCILFFYTAIAARRAQAVIALDTVSVGLPALVAARVTGSAFYLALASDYAWKHSQTKDSLEVFTCKSNYPALVRVRKVLQGYTAIAAKYIFVSHEHLAKVVHLWNVPREMIRVVPPGTIGEVLSEVLFVRTDGKQKRQ